MDIPLLSVLPSSVSTVRIYNFEYLQRLSQSFELEDQCGHEAFTPIITATSPLVIFIELPIMLRVCLFKIRDGLDSRAATSHLRASTVLYGQLIEKRFGVPHAKATKTEEAAGCAREPDPHLVFHRR